MEQQHLNIECLNFSHLFRDLTDQNRSERIQMAYRAVCRATDWCISIDTSESSEELLGALEIRERIYRFWQDAMEL
jgi:hypothetical protein